MVFSQFYATKPGYTAEDGAGRNSPFARAFIEMAGEPGADVMLMAHKVRDSVLEATARGREPFLADSLGGSVVSLNPVE